MTKLYNYLIKNGESVAVGISAILLVIFAVGIYTGSSSGGYTLSELIDKEDLSEVNCFNSGLYMVLFMSGLAVVLMILGVFTDLFKNFKSGSKTMLGFLAVIVAFVVFYFTSSPDTGGRLNAYWGPEFGITEGLSKFISAGLYSLFLLTLISFLLVFLFEVRNFFK